MNRVVRSFLLSACAASGLAVLTMMAASPARAAGNPLEAERWQSRPLVLVAPSADDPLVRSIEGALSQTSVRRDFDDREMVLFTVLAGKGARNDMALSAQQTQALLRALGLKADGPATLVLVGKDGGEKMTEVGHASLQDIFPVIDAMPMRRAR
ncbi:DUF4174 domain-containing protein [Achromobacter sp. KS-M25]|nr:DUF4174 domain-containing protein [Achromobacter aestuarii]